MEWYDDKIYQLMCNKAGEIKKSWKPKPGDFYFGGSYSPQRIIIVYKKSQYECDCIKKLGFNIWLPRQDQLQKMVEDKDYLNQKLNWFITGVYEGDDSEYFYDYCEQFTSMEQLWIAYVMNKKYNKTWNGTDWIENNE